jgi:hypothetical protein
MTFNIRVMIEYSFKVNMFSSPYIGDCTLEIVLLRDLIVQLFRLFIHCILMFSCFHRS